MPPTRRRALRLGAVALAGSVAGCAGGALDAGDADAPGSEATAESEHEAVAFPDGPKSRPERPADLTAERVREYVLAFERRRVYNRLYRDGSTAVSTDCGVESVTTDGEGFRAVVRCSAWANAERDGETRHADYFARYATYFVGPNATVRREGELETREGRHER